MHPEVAFSLYSNDSELFNLPVSQLRQRILAKMCIRDRGVTADTLDRMQALVDAGADAIVIDTAHGHSMFVIEKLKGKRQVSASVA